MVDRAIEGIFDASFILPLDKSFAEKNNFNSSRDYFLLSSVGQNIYAPEEAITHSALKEGKDFDQSSVDLIVKLGLIDEKISEVRDPYFRQPEEKNKIFVFNFPIAYLSEVKRKRDGNPLGYDAVTGKTPYAKFVWANGGERVNGRWFELKLNKDEDFYYLSTTMGQDKGYGRLFKIVSVAPVRDWNLEDH
jgi:hypothetical protein